MLYLNVGESRCAASGLETSDGHAIHYDDTGAVIGLTLLGVRHTLRRDGKLTLRCRPRAWTPPRSGQRSWQPDRGWIVASIPAVAGVMSQGRTRAEARANVIDALRRMLAPEPSEADDRRDREALHLTIAA